jgi:cytochrome c553
VPEALEARVPDKIRTALTTCVSCHGVNFSSPTDGTIPRLAGQYPDYLANALKSYTVEGNPHFGRANPVMGAMAKPLKDETIAEIADYLGSLPGSLRTVPQAKFK